MMEGFDMEKTISTREKYRNQGPLIYNVHQKNPTENLDETSLPKEWWEYRNLANILVRVFFPIHCKNSE